jgi:uncharacterized OB-fold protein
VAGRRKVNFSYMVYRPLIRLFVGLIILAIVNIILTSLPMITALQIPVIPITINAIISLIIGIIMISLLITFRREFVPRLEGAAPSFKELADIIHAATNIAIIVVAYLMFDEAILPFLKQYTWIYPLVFLALVLWPLIALIVALYKSSDKLADEATFKIAEIRGELIRCPHCTALIPSNARYCTNCSTKIALAVAKVHTTRCVECGTENNPGDIYCLECGSPLPSPHENQESAEE